MIRSMAVAKKSAALIVILLLWMGGLESADAQRSSNVRGAPRSKDDKNNSSRQRRVLKDRIFNFLLWSELFERPLTHEPSSVPSENPSNEPTNDPTITPSPTFMPTKQPSTNPTTKPSTSPSQSPTHMPTTNPSTIPTYYPSLEPTIDPTHSPTTKPSKSPTLEPTNFHFKVPSPRPSQIPTLAPTEQPSELPTTNSPSNAPSPRSSEIPTLVPTEQSSESPTTNSPSKVPSPRPSEMPTFAPTEQPSESPSTNSPSMVPSPRSSEIPTFAPTEQPSESPTTNSPSMVPSPRSSEMPTLTLTEQPSGSPTDRPRAPPFPTISSSSSPSTALPTATPTKQEPLSLAPTLRPNPNPTPQPSFSPSTNMPSDHPTNTQFPCLGSQLEPDKKLYVNQYICSPDGRYHFGLDKEGDLSLWEDGLTKIWSGVTCCTGINVAFTMQGDGNAVVRSSFGALWSSKTHGNAGAYLTVENNGIVYILKELSSSSPPKLLWELDYCGYLVRPLPQPGPSPPGLVPVDASTLTNKIMAGYQGWFGTPCDDGYNKWKHWTGGRTPAPGRLGFEMWPDLREFDDDELCATDFKFSDGSNAGLFSSATTKTVERHTKWMYDYGIDGVFVQRFVNELRNDRCIRDKIISNIRKGSEQYGRVFANMYDVSGANANDVYIDIMKDWMHMVDVERITESDRYLHHKGRPVVSIWGFGVTSRPGTPAGVAELINWFHHEAEDKYRATVLGGVPTGWRTLTRDSKTDPAWANVYRSFDIISPWTVGRYSDNRGADNFREDYIDPDVAECKRYGIDYMPVVFPGFSVSNYKPQKPFNEIPRNGGNFFWNQIHNALDAGISQVYVAMFDEVDEGTAIFKVTETRDQTPLNQDFVTLDVDGYSVPSDWYLWLTGNATEWLRHCGLVPSTMPALPPSSSSSMQP